jgi:hypothetical protein
MNNVYEILEICLQDIERGENIETVLFRYPDVADELRPILEGSMHARSMAIVGPSPEVMRRNRAKVLQHAAQMREANVKPASPRRIWLASLRRMAVTLAVVVLLLVSGTGLVSAASTTLPGDNLYPVKRTWEDLTELLTLDLQHREALEIQHETQRIYEVQELFAAGVSAEVDFSGLVTSQDGNEWIIADIRVVVTDQTEVRDGPIIAGDAVRVRGQTQPDGSVLAERVRLLSPGENIPDEVENEEKDNDNSGKGSRDESSNSGPGSDNSGPGSGENENDGNNENDDSNDNGGSDNSGSGSGDNSGSNSNDDGSHSGSNDSGGGGSGSNSNDDSGGDSGDDSSGGGSGSNSNDDSSGHGSGGDSGSEEDNSGPGGGSDDSGSGGGNDNE